jgi:uncharacterized protein
MTTEHAPPHETMSESASWSQLRQAEVGRLAVALDDGPDIFPVNFVVDRGSVVFRTAAGTKLAASAGRPVAFEVDGYDAAVGQAWSVVVKGMAHEVKGFDAVIDALHLPLFPWHRPSKPRIVRIEPASISGRRFHVRTDSRAARTPRAGAE